MRWLLLSIALAAAPAGASRLAGPARFCGYSPIIDLLPGERVTTLQGGIHGGSFRWTGAFGTLEVDGVGWAARPAGTPSGPASNDHPTRFPQVRKRGEYVVAIWNGANGAAYFRARRPLSVAQLAAIDRVRLFQEGQDPQGCRLRTIFSWE